MAGSNTKATVERLLQMGERHNLHHVKTLRYDDVQSVLKWLNAEDFIFSLDEDTVTGLNRCLRLHKLKNVRVVNIWCDDLELKGVDRLVVHVDRSSDNAGHKYSSIVLFIVIQCEARAPYSRTVRNAIEEMKKIDRTRMFPGLQRSTPQLVEPSPQQEFPVIDGFLPQSGGYRTVTHKTPNVTVDNFGLKYDFLKCTAQVNPWSIYSHIPRDTESEFDVEKLITEKNKVLGRGGFGVVVSISDHLVAKTNLFPDMVNWSMPSITDDFTRYAHVASQVEEVMIGVSIKNPYILRTFGGFWCDIPGYRLGGRVVIIMERALATLQDFTRRVNDSAAVPVVEVDTLKGLKYLRSRALQHRDFTYKNVLVCHQPGRKPVPYAFKISDFGTSCNFSTPDQPRGNRTNMAPEVLWCMNAATGSDIFSWYCVMWELHNHNNPLIPYNTSPGQGYCRPVYAKNLSDLVGVYNPENDDAFEAGYMKSMNARALHATHKDRRPSARQIQTSLNSMGRSMTDRNFVSMGALCITLFPQERLSPSQLLNLPRYRALSEDIDEALLPRDHRLPSSVQVGEYRTTDIIVADDCAPAGLVDLVAASQSPVITFDTKDKVYYGIDFIRLAPDYIQPYQWYLKKVKDLQGTYSNLNKRKGGTIDIGNVRRSRCTAGVSAAAQGREHEPAATQDDELLSTRSSVAHLEATEMLPKGLSRELGVMCSDEVKVYSELLETLRATNAEALIPRGDEVRRVVTDATQPPVNPMNSEMPPSEPNAESVSETVDEPQGTVHVRGRKVEGEVDTTVVILQSYDEKEIARFKDNVVGLSQSLTRAHPLIFAGPRGGSCRCSRRTGVFVFQYAQYYMQSKQLVYWNESDSPISVYVFLLQVFLTLKAALDVKLLPTHMTEWKDILIAKGAVMIDIVGYLSRSFNKPPSSLFGDQCHNLIDLCAALVEGHLPNSSLSTWLRDLTAGTSASVVLTGLIENLPEIDQSERITPSLLTPHGNYFTFKDYLSDIPNWLTSLGEEETHDERYARSKLLVYGTPTPIRGNQAAADMSGTKLRTLVKNIVLRMRAKIFGSSRVEVTALDCTRGLTEVTLVSSALSGIPSMDRLDPRLHTEERGGLTHDAVSPTASKWAPVILFTKCKREGPIQDFNVVYYEIKILVVLLSQQGSVQSLSELFRSMTTFSTTDY